MTLPFGSGLDQPQETLLAAAVVERLRLLHCDNGLFLRCVAEAPVLPSHVRERESWDKLLAVMNTRAPAVLVVVESARTTPGEMSVTRSDWVRTYDVTLAVFSNHARDMILGRLDPDAASRGDDRKDPGLRATCELIENLLLGFKLDLEWVDEIEPGRGGMQTVYAGEKGTLREMHYTVEARIERTEWPDIPRYLESIHTTLGALELHMETEVSS